MPTCPKCKSAEVVITSDSHPKTKFHFSSACKCGYTANVVTILEDPESADIPTVISDTLDTVKT